MNDVKQLTIVPKDSLVIVNGIPKIGIDLSFLDKSIHAVQWKENSGEIEYESLENGRYNESINSLENFMNVVDLWENFVVVEIVED